MRIKVLLILLLAVPFIYGQTNDRRRYQSQVFMQGRRIEQEASRSLWKFGTLSLTPILGFRNLGYDSNLFSDEMQEEEDFLISPEVGLKGIFRFSPQWYLSTEATTNYLYYQDQDQLRDWEYGADVRLYGLFKRVYFDIGADFRRDRQRLSSEIDNRLLSERANVSMELIIQPTPRGHLIIKPSYFSLAYDADEAGLDERFVDLERDETEVNLSYLYKIRPDFWPYAEIAQTEYDFDIDGNPRDDSEMSAYYLGARNEFGQRYHYNVRLGITDLSFDNAPQIDDEFFSVRAFLNYKLTRRYELNAGVQRNPIFSLTRDYAYFLSTRISAGFFYSFRNRLQLGPEIIIGENEYDQPINPDQVDILRQDDLTNYNLNAKFPLVDILEWNITLGWQERDSNLPGNSSDGIQISSSISYRPGN